MSMDTITKHGIDAAVWAALAGVILNLLPLIAVLFGVAWHSYQIYDLYDRRKKGKKDAG